ncbi:MAG: hypothetical protein KAI73_12515 [Rhodospirillaceae bacterium]|nr:hypothetical protein [Rhodospirillaceae bacterium]
MNKKTEPHSITRARERLGKSWGDSDLRQISDLIMNGKSVLRATCRRRGTQAHIVQYDGVTFTVIFDPENTNIVTFLGNDFKLSKDHKHRRKKSKLRTKHRAGRSPAFENGENEHG